ncbi:MAG: hypothetical protein AMXMBFR33_22480 [Candidatus Xenobia bacterium]
MARRRGVGLGTTLIVTAIVALLGFALAGASVTHINLMTHTGNASMALDLARSSVHVALGHLFTDKDFRQTVTVNGPGGAVGQLTFDPAQATSLGIPLSENNLTGGSSKLAADNQMVPEEGAYLVGVATVRGVTRRVRAVVHLPPFPFAAASDGPIVSPGSLVVGSLRPGQDPNSPPNRLLPADLLTNDTGLAALTLGPATNVRGDLRSGGGVSLDPGVQVGGRVLTSQAPRLVPVMSVTGLDPDQPAPIGHPFLVLQSSYSGTTFTGTLRGSGTVTVNGPLKLDRALVYIDGNLEINGGVDGTGVLVTTGNLTVNGQASVVADSRVAMLSQGKITLAGNGPVGSSIKGLVYAEGGVDAKQLKLQGALVSRNQPPVQLDRARLLNDGGLLQPPFNTLPYVTPVPEVRYIHGTAASPGPMLKTAPSPPANPVNGTRFGYSKVEATFLPDGRVQVNARSFSRTYRVPPGGWVDDPGYPMDSSPSLNSLASLGHRSDPLRDSLIDPPLPGTGGSAPTYTLVLDPAELLPTKDRARILIWREGAQ